MTQGPQEPPVNARIAAAEIGPELTPAQSLPSAPTARSGARESPSVLFGLLPSKLSRESLSPDQVIEKLRQWSEWARGAHAPNTETAWASDWRGWLEFCAARAEEPLPANPLTVRAYIERRAALGRRKSTIRRNVATIAAAHAAADLPNPCEHSAVHLALKVMGRTLPGGVRQARGLVWTEIAQFLAVADNDMRTVRERALLCVGYDAMTRREELVAVDCEDLTWCADGSARLLIRRSKTDAEAEGSVLYLAPQTASYVRTWLERSEITTGPIFRRIVGRARIDERLGVDSVTDILKRVVARIGLPKEAVRATSGHSLRVGATQDLLALNEGLAAIMHTGRWKDARMVEHYGRHLLAGRSAMARAAHAQGRTLGSTLTDGAVTDAV